MKHEYHGVHSSHCYKVNEMYPSEKQTGEPHKPSSAVLKWVKGSMSPSLPYADQSPSLKKDYDKVNEVIDLILFEINIIRTERETLERAIMENKLDNITQVHVIQRYLKSITYYLNELYMMYNQYKHNPSSAKRKKVEHELRSIQHSFREEIYNINSINPVSQMPIRKFK